MGISVKRSLIYAMPLIFLTQNLAKVSHDIPRYFIGILRPEDGRPNPEIVIDHKGPKITNSLAY